MPPEPVDSRVQLIEALWGDPEARKELEEIIVKKFPASAVALPGFEARKEAGAVLDTVKAERAEWRKERDADRATQLLAESRQRIIDDPRLGITEAEIPEVERIMAEELVGTHRSAAELYVNRKAAIAGAGGGTNGLMEVPGRNGAGGEDYKGIVEDRDAWARKKAHEVLNDLARQRGTMPTAWQA